MSEAHYHNYDLSRWPEAKCVICGDIGMYPPIERVPIEDGREGYRPLHPSSGPAFWCQVCGAHFMTEKWARDHMASVAALNETHVIIQLRYES